MADMANMTDTTSTISTTSITKTATAVATTPSFSAAEVTTVAVGETITIPVMEETVSIGKRMIESGGVRVVKTVSEREETINQTLMRETVSVDRVAVNRLLEKNEDLPVARTEGDVYIVPLFEEVVITEKRVRLVEEMRITRTRTETASPQTVTVRRENVSVEPIAAATDLQTSQEPKQTENK